MSSYSNCSTSKRIFSNCFTLNIENEKIQEIFEEGIREKKYTLLIYLIITTIIMLTGLISSCTLNIRPDLISMKYYGYVCLGLQCICFILYFIQLKFKQVSNAFLYFNIINVVFNSFYFGEYIKMFLTKEEFYDYALLIHSINIISIMSYILFVDNNFIRVFVAIVINLTILIIATVEISTKIEVVLLDAGIALLIHLILYYIWCRISKELLYYKEKFDMQKQWIYEVLNHWDSGMIIFNVDKHKLKFFNNYLKKYEQFQEAKSVKNYNQQNEMFNDNENHRIVSTTDIHENLNIQENNLLTRTSSKFDHDILTNNNIFKDLFDINQNLPQELIIAFATKGFQEIIDIINQNYPSTGDNLFFKEFIFLGRINLNNEFNKGIFELSMHGFNSAKGIYYEFMINDVTKTKQLEEDIIKEKTMLLGKISHELKNPLIVVDEVVEELIENQNLRWNNQTELKRMYFIKNLCNYMIILVKDFEVIANMENLVVMYPTIEELELNYFLADIQQIVETLLEKKSSNNVKFQLNVDKNINKMKTDSIRLKQILINLLSNSVKFTDMGIILLKVELIKIPCLSVKLKIDENKESRITVSKIKNNDKNGIFEFNETKRTQSEFKVYFRFSIIDTGKGLSRVLIDLINSEKEVNFIKKDNCIGNKLGTGYGLNIVQRLCKLLNSKLYTIEKLEGSEFYFDILQENFEYPSEVNEMKYEGLRTAINYNYDVDNNNIFSKNEVQNNNPVKSDNNIDKVKSFHVNDKLYFDSYSSLGEVNSIPALQGNDIILLPINSAEEKYKEDKEFKEDKYDKKIKDILTNKKTKFYESVPTIKKKFDYSIPNQFKVDQLNIGNQLDLSNNPKRPDIKNTKPSGINSNIIVEDKNNDLLHPENNNTQRRNKNSCVVDKKGKNFQFNSVDVNTSSKFKLNNNEQSQILESKLVTDLNSNNSSLSDAFELKLKSSYFEFNKYKEQELGEAKKYMILIVDDEVFIRNSMKRVVSREFKELNKNIELTIIEANDGIEGLLVLYLASNKNLKIDCIISDETMPFISGSFFSKILSDIVSKGTLKNIKMFISTALNESSIKDNYSKSVNKIYSKPLDKNSVKDIIKMIM